MARSRETRGRCSPGWRPPLLASLAVRPVAAAVRAVLHQLHAVRVVAPVLPRDVVAVLALLAGQGDLRPHVGGSHSGVPFSQERACESGPTTVQPPTGADSSASNGSCNDLGHSPARGFQGVVPLGQYRG